MEGRQQRVMSLSSLSGALARNQYIPLYSKFLVNTSEWVQIYCSINKTVYHFGKYVCPLWMYVLVIKLINDLICN